MFYIKTKQHSGKMVSTEITDENVFTRCPECGREMPVDLAEIFADAKARFRALLSVPETYEILFLQGGATA